MNSGVSGLAPANQVVDISQLDLQSALMAVQSQRAQALEGRLMEQMQRVQDKNAEIQRLNMLKNELAAISAKKKDAADTFTAEDQAKMAALREVVPVDGLTVDQIDAKIKEYKDSHPLDPSDGSYVHIPPNSRVQSNMFLMSAYDLPEVIDDAAMKSITVQLDMGFIKQDDLTKLGITPEMVAQYRQGIDPAAVQDTNARSWAAEEAKKYAGVTQMGAQPLAGLDYSNKGQLDKYIADLGTRIDGLTNTQQMDMLSLQSLSNKRNEAYEIMTNFIKKLSDQNSQIIGNLR